MKLDRLERRGKRNYFRSIYFTIALFSCIAAVFICLITGEVAKRTGTSLLIASSENHLNWLSSTANTLAETGENLVVEIFGDREIVPLLYKRDAKPNEAVVGLARLNSYRESSSFVHSIYVFNRESGYVYSTLSEGRVRKEDFFDKEIVDYLDGKKEFDLKDPVPRSIQDKTRPGLDAGYADIYTFVCYDKGGEDISNAVIVNVSQKWLDDLLAGVGKDKEEQVFIINKEGILMSSADNVRMLTDISDRNFVKKILAQETESGYFLDKEGTEEFLVTYMILPEFKDWIFVKLNNYGELLRPVEHIHNSILLLIVISCLVLSFLAYGVSRHLYRPIRTMEINLNRLKREYNRSGYELKNAMLQNFLNGNVTYSNAAFEDTMKKYGIRLMTGSAGRLVLLRIDNLKKFRMEYSREDRELIRFALCNICEELGNHLYPCTVVKMQNGNIAALFSGDGEENGIEGHKMEGFVHNVQENVWSFGHITVSAVISEETEDISAIGELYEETAAALNYFLFCKRPAVILAEEIRQVEKRVYVYPRVKHEQLFMNLRAGKKAETVEGLSGILEEAAGYSYNAFMSMVYHLIYYSNMLLNELSARVQIVCDGEQTLFLKQIEEAENLDDIRKTFESLFAKIYQLEEEIMTEKREKDSDGLICQVKESIDAGYTDMNFCIQAIADKLDMSSAYLGRVYRKNTGTSITECITDKRMEKSSELLLGSELSINEISDFCGFGSITYFYRIFKKRYGVTPNIYRTSHESCGPVKEQDVQQ